MLAVTRRLFMALSVLSLVACLATVSLWVTSYHKQPGFNLAHTNNWVNAEAEGGKLLVVIVLRG